MLILKYFFVMLRKVIKSMTTAFERIKELADKQRISLNDLEDKMEIKKGNLLDVVKGRADLIVSNIIAEIIVDEIKNLKNHMEKGGIFITSGIIKERRQMVIHALEENGFEIIDELEKNNWVAIVGRLNV